MLDAFLNPDFRLHYVQTILFSRAEGLKRKHRYADPLAEHFRVGRHFMREHLLKLRVFLPPPWFVASGDMSTYDFFTKLPTFPPRSEKFDDVGGMLGELFPNKPFAQAGVGAPLGVCPCSERHPDAVRLCFVDRLCDAIVEEAQGYSTRSSSERSALGQV